MRLHSDYDGTIVVELEEGTGDSVIIQLPGKDVRLSGDGRIWVSERDMNFAKDSEHKLVPVAN